MYESFFGLEEPPFRLTPDPRYLFLSRRHREALGHLSFGLRDGAGFVAITGEIGAGKTTLLRSVLRDADTSVQYAYVMNPVLTGVEVLQEINHELGIAEEGGRRELLAALNACLLERKREGRQVVIVVDEAQALDGAILEELRMLSNFETETSKLLQIVLVGQPELRDLLARPELTQLNQRITVRFHLTALDKKETGEYIEHRLGVASRAGPREIFTRSALVRVHRHTRGLPRLINQLCHRALLGAYAADHSRVTRRLVDRAAGELKEALTAPRVVAHRGFAFEAAVAVVALGVLASIGMAVWRWPAWRVTPETVPQAAEIAVQDEIQVSMIELGEVALADLAPVPEEPEPAVEAGAPMAAFVGTLRHASAEHSAYEAIEAILRVWPAAPLSPSESAGGAFDLRTIAGSRALSYVSVDADVALLRVLDLPAILELAVPGEAEPRFGMVAQLDREQAVFHFTGEVVQLPVDLLDAYWNGRAHFFWEDIDELGPLLSDGSAGPEVERLHLLLADVGVYRGAGGDIYNPATAAAVARFQQRMGLESDGKVGPMTMIALYRKGVPGAMPRLARVPEPVEIGGRGNASAVVLGSLLPGEGRP